MTGNSVLSQTAEPSKETVIHEPQIPKPSLPDLHPPKLEPFTNESLEKAWRDFADTIKSENTRLYSILTSHVPKLEGDAKIVFPISNALQKEPLQKIETRLLHHLQKALDNANVEIEIALSENSETPKAYTNEDKFAQMSLKNPALKTFKHQFMLDFV